MKKLLNALLGLLLCLPLAAQQTYHITPTGSGDGSSWESASGNLVQVLAIAKAGDQIWVKEGTYYPTKRADRTASFVVKDGVKLYGGFGGFETSLSERNWSYRPSTLSGEIGSSDQNDNSFTVITTCNVRAETVIDGFIITGGNSNGKTSAVGHYTRCGGGWYNDGSNGRSSSPTIVNCTFIRNTALEGGAFYSNGNGGFTRPTFINVSFQENRADLDGGAVYNDNRNGGKGTPVLDECVFTDNLASYGAGIFVKSASTTANLDLRNCTFQNNTAFLWGGGIFTMGQTSDKALKMIDCEFAENYPTDINKTYSLTKKD